MPKIVVILRRNSLYETLKGPKSHICAQLQTIVHELQRVALSPHLRGLSPRLKVPKKSAKEAGARLSCEDRRSLANPECNSIAPPRRGTGGAKPGSGVQRFCEAAPRPSLFRGVRSLFGTAWKVSVAILHSNCSR